MPVWLIVALIWCAWMLVSLFVIANSGCSAKSSRFVVLCTLSLMPLFILAEGVSRGYNWLFASR